jgi:hypothetical protein
MTTIDVAPAALISAAAAVRCFSADLDPVVLRSDLLSEAVTVFSSRWRQAVESLAADADTTATALRDAAIRYAELDALLVPRVLR